MPPGAVNFALTNRIPRNLATRFMGWFSRIEQPAVRAVSLWAWQRFADLRLHEAKKAQFTSVHDCFVRELRPGARPVDQSHGVLVSPCDGIVGAHGMVQGTRAFQVKDSAYSIEELLADGAHARRYEGGQFVTLRLTASMYHRFHAPEDCEVDEVVYVPGDTWNVNPPALQRVPKLFCRNERAVVPLRLTTPGHSMTLVPVAAILVASLRFHFVDTTLDMRYAGPRRIPCRATLRRGQEMGYFQHGSTIIAFATPGLRLCDHVREGLVVRVGQALFRHA